MRAVFSEVQKSTSGLFTVNEKTAHLRPRFMEMILGTFWPVLVFAYIFRMQLGFLRHQYGFWVVLGTMALPVLDRMYWTYVTYKKLRKGQRVVRWLLVMNIMLWFVIFAASLEGEKTFWRYSFNYFEYDGLASYVNIDPSTDRGQSYMDAGQIYFKEGTRVDTTKAIAFQEDQIYCAAPIVQKNIEPGEKQLTGGVLELPKSGTIDFWAVGMNCCDPSGLNFKCGEAKNKIARAGMRVIRNDVRPYYLMAVQEWTAWLKMPAKHPLFFHWTQDPLAQVENLWLQAMTEFTTRTVQCVFAVSAGTILLNLLFYEFGF